MKKILFVVLGIILLSGCSRDNEVLKMRAELDSLKSIGKVKYEKIEKLSNPDVSVYAVGEDTTYFEGKARLVNYGVEFSNEVANVIGRKSFVSVDGLTVDQLRSVLTELDSLRKTNTK